jgi:DNA-binding MltR family transcriptional regulator
MFDPSGPLGSFSTKIVLAFLIGMFTKESTQDLHIIREVRNEFAHKPKDKKLQFLTRPRSYQKHRRD